MRDPRPTLSDLEAECAVWVGDWGLPYAFDVALDPLPDSPVCCRVWDGGVSVDHPRFVTGALVLGREARRVASEYRQLELSCEWVVRRLAEPASRIERLHLAVRVAVPAPEVGLSEEAWRAVFLEALFSGRTVSEADRLCRAMLGAGVVFG